MDTLAPEGILDLDEHRTIEISLSGEEAERVLSDVAKTLAVGIANGLLSVATETNASGVTKLCITTNSTVGFASASAQSADGIFIRVRPKVGTRRMLELAALAGMLPEWNPGEAHISETLEDALVEWTLRAYAQSLQNLLASGGLRNTHERLRYELNGRLRGRLLVNSWLRNVARGSPQLIPAEFPALNRDNDSNRFLRWAIHLGKLASRNLSNRSVVIDQLMRVERQFGGVSLMPPRRPLLDIRTLPPNHGHYNQALKFARYIIENLHLGGEAGDHKGTAIALDMNMVYQNAFFEGLRKIEPNVVRNTAWPVTLAAGTSENFTRTTPMNPDVYMSGDRNTNRMPIVIDTKWKKAIKSRQDFDDQTSLISTTNSNLVSVKREDLYQATAYALEVLHRSHQSASPIDACVTALVYPVLADTPSFGRELSIGGSKIIIRIVGWNVAENPQSGIDAVWQGLRTLAESKSAHSVRS